MVHEDICPPQVYATSIFLLFKAFLALIWHEGTMGQAAQINVVVFDLASRGQYVGKGLWLCPIIVKL